MSNSRQVATALEPGIHEQMCHVWHKGVGGCVHLNYLMLGRNGDEGLPANQERVEVDIFTQARWARVQQLWRGTRSQRSAWPVCWAQAES